MNGYNYDSWLNSNNPYDLADEEEIHDYLFHNRIEDPREEEK